MSRRKPTYIVPITVTNSLVPATAKHSVPVYGNFRNPWMAQAAAASKFNRTIANGFYKDKSYLVGDYVVDHPRRLDGASMEEWGVA